MMKILLGKDKIDLSNVIVKDVKLHYPTFKDAGCFVIKRNRYLRFICTDFFIGLGKEANERNIIPVLNHEVIHSVLLKNIGINVGCKFDNICPNGDLFSEVEK